LKLPNASKTDGCGTAFLDALAFLTRLGPARPFKSENFACCVPFFTPVGIVLGAICTACALLAQKIMDWRPALESSAVLSLTLAALVWLGLEIWLTRGLHWDGLADLADAAGAPAPRFWEILKDSRLGTFGALTLLIIFCGQWMAIARHLAACDWAVLILAPAWGRACAIWLAASSQPRYPQSLGALMKAGVNSKIAAFHALGALLTTLVLGGSSLSWPQTLALPALQCTIIHGLLRLTREKGGFSGDFLGAAIVSGQTCFLLITL
jgi:adenosylcobinamide-GDP ribazoletransferase